MTDRAGFLTTRELIQELALRDLALTGLDYVRLRVVLDEPEAGATIIPFEIGDRIPPDWNS